MWRDNRSACFQISVVHIIESFRFIFDCRSLRIPYELRGYTTFTSEKIGILNVGVDADYSKWFWVTAVWKFLFMYLFWNLYSLCCDYTFAQWCHHKRMIGIRIFSNDVNYGKSITNRWPLAYNFNMSFRFTRHFTDILHILFTLGSFLNHDFSESGHSSSFNVISTGDFNHFVLSVTGLWSQQKMESHPA